MKISRVIFTCLFVSCSLIYGLQVYAQNSNSERNIQFIFIDHEPSLNSGKFIKQLRSLRTECKELGNVLVLYMPNSSRPFISVTGTKDNSGHGYDSQSAFDDLCEALNKSSHEKLPGKDRQRFVDLFDSFDVFDSNGKLNYANLTVDFYLTPEFWEYEYNKTILAPIYFALDVPEMLKQNCFFNVYVDSSVSEKYGNKLFGDMNIDGINSKLQINDYDF